MESLTQQARSLSSGTLATLTGENTYSQIETIQNDFTEFCEENSRYYGTWQEAWPKFWGIYQSFRKAGIIHDNRL